MFAVSFAEQALLSGSYSSMTVSQAQLHNLPPRRTPEAANIFRSPPCPRPVAWAEKLGHLRAMAAQPTSEDNAADGPAAGQPSAGEDAPLKLEKFLPYQLNVVASLTSQALSRVYSRRYGIGVPDWRVLVTLGQYGVMT